MLIFTTIIHVLLSVFMILVILLQPGKDAGMGAAFGGGAATSAFGGRGATTFLSKLTAICAGLFFLTSLGLSFVGLGSSVADRIPNRAATPPAATSPAAVEPAPGETPDMPAATEGSAMPEGQTPVPHNVPPAQPAQEVPATNP